MIAARHNFIQRLSAASSERQSLLCIGLDPDPELMPVSNMIDFNRTIIESVGDIACAFKPNLGFYESAGSAGIAALETTIEIIREKTPNSVIIGDGKRGDIQSTNVQYARAIFEHWGFDATTVNAYGGYDAMEPFLSYKDKGVFVWCKSSNPSSGEFQDLTLPSGRRFFEELASRAADWNTDENVGLVIGATYPQDLSTIRKVCPSMPILLPGVGAQGGKLEASVKAGIDENGRGLLVSSSRGVIYASSDPITFGRASREAASKLRDLINKVLGDEGKGW